MKKATATKRDVAAEVTARIIAALERGVAPWARPWKTTGGDSFPGALPVNATTGKEYRGANILLLWITAEVAGYADNRWLTFNQAKKLGGSVKKGERGTGLVFWKFVSKVDPATGEEERRGFPNFFTVFNVEQCEGLGLEVAKREEAPVVGYATEIAKRVEARVVVGGDRACYMPVLDVVHVPAPDAFVSVEAFDATLLHELTHWTGHTSRLARDKAFGNRFGDGAYAMEELVAELGAAFCSARLGIPHEKLQHESYIAKWLETLRGDKHAVFTASREAQRAADLLCPAESAEETDAGDADAEAA